MHGQLTDGVDNAGALFASLEMSASQVLQLGNIDELIPRGVRVYLPQLGNQSDAHLVGAARRLTDLGYRAVPHFASRRLTGMKAFESRLKALAQEAGVTDILVVAGALPRPLGSFAATMDLLETGLLENQGITDLGVAGHPEGSPDFAPRVAAEALALKQAFGQRSGIDVRIVSQFAFDAGSMIAWAEGLRGDGIDLPIHLGVAGPAKLATLLRYAVACGVGNSVAFLKNQRRSLTALARGYSPESLVAPVERHLAARPDSAICQLHVYPFGGVVETAQWLVRRGSWAAVGKR